MICGQSHTLASRILVIMAKLNCAGLLAMALALQEHLLHLILGHLEWTKKLRCSYDTIHGRLDNETSTL
jgi:hypothetical protein